MRICVILEGSYPYVTGGVSTWMQEYMEAMPQHEFVVWAVGADNSLKGKFKYILPKNVVGVQEVFLNEALKPAGRPKRYVFSEEEKQVLRDFIDCNHPDWEMLFRMYAEKQVGPMAFLMSEDFLNILTQICENEYPYTAFSDLFHTVRSMLLPILYILQSKVPKADVYHAIATGYSGILARLGSYINHVPYVVTEHGIYTREREEEIIRADWVIPAFKKFWVRFFNMLSDGAYEKATMITSLFGGARKIQLDMGCDPDKCRYIVNGVHYDRFRDIGRKKANGYIDIGAVLRIAPIKDVKSMIYAFGGLKEKVPNARLFIAGPREDKEYAQECHDLIKRLQIRDITFMGTVNVAEHMGDFDFTVLTSISEGMPLCVLESFAAGVPCVVTDVGSCKELMMGISPDDTFGDAGICVPPMDIQGLTDAMYTLSTHHEKRFQMGIAARNRASKYFLHEDMIAHYLDLYREVFARWQESDLA